MTPSCALTGSPNATDSATIPDAMWRLMEISVVFIASPLEKPLLQFSNSLVRS